MRLLGLAGDVEHSVLYVVTKDILASFPFLENLSGCRTILETATWLVIFMSNGCCSGDCFVSFWFSHNSNRCRFDTQYSYYFNSSSMIFSSNKKGRLCLFSCTSNRRIFDTQTFITLILFLKSTAII